MNEAPKFEKGQKLYVAYPNEDGEIYVAECTVEHAWPKLVQVVFPPLKLSGYLPHSNYTHRQAAGRFSLDRAAAVERFIQRTNEDIKYYEEEIVTKSKLRALAALMLVKLRDARK